ncbi:MAG: hypothetical protein QOJ89_2282 [bacterium]|jgi:hypothetical protein
MLQSPSIVIRTATHSDADTLERLAILDEREPLAGPVLLAEVNGVARAALDLSDGSVIADPFFRTAALVSLLHAHKPSSRRTMRSLLASKARHPHVAHA